MKKIRSGLHGLYVVKDKDGRGKCFLSSQYSKDYLEQSINNPRHYKIQLTLQKERRW